MMKPVIPHVDWVGKVDWELRRFHGDEYSTHRGTSYNSYLVRDEKTVLIDTVWEPYADEFIADLEREIDLASIDYLIVNHAEVDHSGSLPKLMERIPDTPIYCTENGIKSLKGHYHQNWNYHTVSTGDRLNIGERDLVFIEAPMLHWPDTMFTYMTEDHVLFSSDAFGQHYAAELLFNDQADQAELYEEAVKYYANILTPFSAQVMKKIKEILGMQLPLSMICTSHGVIWRNNPAQIVEQYLKWADAYQEDQITILYDTMWKATRRMAEHIAGGIREQLPETVVKLYNTAVSDKNDVITEVFKSKAVLIGSPTINRGILTSIAGVMEEITGLRLKGKYAAAFGSYGWSGESVSRIEKLLADCGFTLLCEGQKILWQPDEAGLKACRDFGKQVALKMN